MDPVPLIPKSNQVKSHDTAHIIGEVFQDIITAPEYSKNVAENAEKFISDNPNLKAAGTRVITAYNGSKIVMEDIGFVEDNMMINQGKFINEYDFISKDETLTELLKLKRKDVFLNIDSNKTQKYGLLQKLDLLPNKPEISMDFRINSNRHGCAAPCPNNLDVYPTKLEENKGKKKFVLSKDNSLGICTRKSKDSTMAKQDRPVIFKAAPETVIFKEYELGVVYVKRFKLRNISKTSQAFIPRILPKTSFFTVELESGSTRVAPGVCVVFRVKYQTDIYKDVEEIMIFNTYIGQDVEVKLKSSRRPPNLTAFIFKNLQHFTERFIPLDGLDFHDKGRAIALNSTIDCGSCFLGSQIKFNLILKNDGTIGRFFILSEDDWCVADISGINKGMQLTSQAFHIYPTYFEIDTNEFVELDVTFYPLNFGLEVEKLFLLCNNNTLEELEIVGDGVLFEINSVIIQVENKNPDMIDMDSKSTYFLNLGKCIPYQKQICTFHVCNNRKRRRGTMDSLNKTISFTLAAVTLTTATKLDFAACITDAKRSLRARLHKIVICIPRTRNVFLSYREKIVAEDACDRGKTISRALKNFADKNRGVLTLGRTYPRHSTSNISNKNNSIVDLNYKWETRESVCHRKGTKLKKMELNWVHLHKVSSYLPSQSTTDFQLTLECKTNKTGLYSLVFTLYVLDIPEASLVESKTFYAIERETSRASVTDRFEQKLLNIIIGEIEIMCEIVPIHIELDPENITLPYRMGYEELFKQKVQIYTAGPTQLNCQWIVPITDSVEVCPMQFSLNPETTFICDIIISTYSYQDIEEKLILMVNDGLYQKEFKVTAKVVKPLARFSENVLHFGFLPKGKQVAGKKFYVENIGKERIYWEIFEFYYDHTHSTITELAASKHLSLTCGELKKNESCEITYEIDNCDQHHRWLSFLVLLSSHPTLEAMDSLCLITYEVTQPEVIIHTNSSQLPILYPGKLLYLGVTTFHIVCVHNIGSKLPASFIWGKPVGEHADDLKIICTPKSGIIQPQKCEHITISLMANETGIFDEVYVPCFVGNMDEPIMLTILCVVDNISVYFHIPDEEGRLVKVFWPPKIISDFEGFSLDLDHFESETEEKTPKNNITRRYKHNILHSSYRSCIEQYTTSPTKSDVIREEIPIEPSQPEEEVDNEFQLSLESSESSIVVERTGSSSFVSPSPPLKDYFGSELILQDHMLEYRNVPLRTLVKKTIIIENLTPIDGTFTISTTNFTELDTDDKDRNIMDDILVKLKIKKRDEWEESINGDVGIVVRPTPAGGTVKLEKPLEIDIWVYANTWGTYIEEILIEINDIMPFCFNLLIEIVGIPIEFPIALNSNNEPTLRFGNIPYLSKPITRNLKVSNFGCVPICLEWFVFLRKDKDKDSFDEIAASFYTSTVESKPEEEIMFKSTITQEYGTEDNSIFKVEPQTININPKTTETIAITITTDYYKPKFTITEIEGYLYGFVRLPEKFTFQSNLFTRQTDVHAPPAKVKLLVNLELPLLKLELVKGDVRIKAYANDIIEAQEMRYEKLLVFKNVDSAPAVVYMHTLPPFYIASLKTAQTNTNKKVLAAIIQPGECVEVLVECLIDAEEVLQYSDMLFNEKTTVYSEIPDFKNCAITLQRYLNIHQLGLKKQITSLELILFYPRLYVSHEVIDFGVVFVGNTKKMILTLTNPTGSQLPFTVHKATTSNAVIITPSTGIIPKANGTTPSNIILSLYFIPSECKIYQETIRILTNIPFHSFSVNLIGAGSNNEKFYVEGT